jgi:hypothetical protein
MISKFSNWSLVMVVTYSCPQSNQLVIDANLRCRNAT